MYLKNLELFGFKSFANRTKIDFTEGVTGVVGPNGSGKSNIIDAIMWALGETSAKQLRGSKMEDVIFGGTGKKSALGFAEVLLNFDNKDKYLDIPFEEVSIRRKMYRSGESEFYINKQKVRLKDIREMFMDTGIGKDGYSFIGQGQIEQILSNRPQDRRMVFEEAAGISKYKSKKDESQKGLEKTLENLQRLDDILKEVILQEKKLKEEARVAQEYFEKKGNKDEIFGHILIKKESELLNVKSDLIGKLDQISVELEESKSTQESLFQKKVSLREIERKKEEEENSLQVSRFEGIQKIESIKGQLSSNNLILENITSNIEALEYRIKENLEKKDTYTIQICDAENDIDSDEKFLDDNKRDFLAAEEKWKTLQEDLKREKAKAQDRNIKEKEWIEKSTGLRSKIDSNEYFLKEKRERLVNLKDQEKKIKDQLDEIDFELGKKQEAHREATDLMVCNSNEIQDLVQKKEKIELTYNSFLNKSKDLETDLESKTREINFLKKVYENNEGYSQTVRNFLRQIKGNTELERDILGPVADNLTVEKGYETALSVALGGGAQNIILQNDNNVGKMIKILKDKGLGRLTFYPINTMEEKQVDQWIYSKTSVNFELAIEKISFDESLYPIFSNLLGRILVVDNIEDGRRLSKDLDRRYRIVSKSGDLFQIGGSISGGSIRNNQLDLYNRKSEIDDKEKIIHNITCDMQALKEEISEKYTELEDLSAQIMELERAKEELSLSESKISQLLHNLQSSKDSLTTRLEEIGLELYKEEENISKSENSLEQYYLEMKGIDLQKEEISEDDEDSLSILEKENHLFYQSLMEKKVKINEKESDIRQKNLLIDQLKDRLNEAEKIILASKEEIEENIQEVKKRENNKKNWEHDEENLSISLKRIDEEIASIHGEKNELTKLLREIEEEEKEFYSEILKLERKEEQYSIRLEDIGGKIIDLEAEKKEFFSTHPIPTSSCDLTVKTLEVNYRELDRQILSLGPVNENALNEYKEIKERYDFLVHQKNDLIISKDKLEKVIGQLEKEMRNLFKEAISEIQVNFNEIFKELFNGGNARVELEEGEDLLEAGIEIQVQPPGKKLQSLTLLSGGERSMTAVALLFALLKRRISPFCILDEIDAALDEANIKRYTNYLKQMEKLQFIMITHRKTTMEICERLYGVTMQEEGISSILSMELEEAEKNVKLDKKEI